LKPWRRTTWMYRVEYFSVKDNSWVKSSYHRNLEHAEVNMEVLVQGGKKARIIHNGKIIAKGGKWIRQRNRGPMNKHTMRNEIAEGRQEIMDLCGLTSWRGVLKRKKKKAGFKSLFRTNPGNGKPVIIIEEYNNYRIEYNKLKSQ
jgi:hypothetical protein